MLPESLATALEDADPASAVLHLALAHFGCQTGTVHILVHDVLKLAAHVNIPSQLLPIIETVPVGKGIAGLAALKGIPITICNLQTDDSGQARPGAKATGMEGSVAVPMIVDTEIVGVFGIAKAEAHDWTDKEKAELMEIAAQLGVKHMVTEKEADTLGAEI